MIEWLKAFWQKHIMWDFPEPGECWWCHNTSCSACKVVVEK